MVIVNMSVWQNIESLWDFVYGEDHLAIMRQRRKWFRSRTAAYSVLWWVPAGHEPTVEEGMERLARLDADGPCSAAFTFKRAFGPDGLPRVRASERPPVAC